MEGIQEQYWLAPEIQADHRRKSRNITIGVYALLILLSFFSQIKTAEPPETSEGIYINFGNTETGYGNTEPMSDPVAVPEETPTNASPTPTPEDIQSTSDVAGVDLEASPEPTPVKKPKEVKVEEVKKPVETKKEVKPIKEKPIDKSKLLDPSLLKGTGESQGDKVGTFGNMGQEDGGAGSVYFGKNSGKGKTGFGDLDIGNGRDWAQRPYMNKYHQVRDKLVLEIQVDRDGNVIKAVVARGSTITDQSLIKTAIEAVKRSKVTPDPKGEVIQKGKVVFDFKLQ